MAVSVAETAAALAEAQARLGKLLKQQTSAVSAVSQGDKMVRFRPADEMAIAVAVQRAEIARLEGLLGIVSRAPIRQVRFVSSKGL